MSKKHTTISGRMRTHRPNPQYGIAWQDRIASGDPLLYTMPDAHTLQNTVIFGGLDHELAELELRMLAQLDETSLPINMLRHYFGHLDEVVGPALARLWSPT
jgi:hypothetical protein